MSLVKAVVSPLSPAPRDRLAEEAYALLCTPRIHSTCKDSVYLTACNLQNQDQAVSRLRQGGNGQFQSASRNRFVRPKEQVPSRPRACPFPSHPTSQPQSASTPWSPQ